MKRSNFAFRYEWSQAIAHLAPEYRLEIIEATIRYAETGETGQLSEIAAQAFETHIYPDFKRRQKAAEYRRRLKERRQANEIVPEVEAKEEKSQPVCEVPATPPATRLNRHQRRQLEAEQRRRLKKYRHHQLPGTPVIIENK